MINNLEQIIPKLKRVKLDIAKEVTIIDQVSLITKAFIIEERVSS